MVGRPLGGIRSDPGPCAGRLVSWHSGTCQYCSSSWERHTGPSAMGRWHPAQTLPLTPRNKYHINQSMLTPHPGSRWYSPPWPPLLGGRSHPCLGCPLHCMYTGIPSYGLRSRQTEMREYMPSTVLRMRAAPQKASPRVLGRTQPKWGK